MSWLRTSGLSGRRLHQLLSGTARLGPISAGIGAVITVIVLVIISSVGFKPDKMVQQFDQAGALQHFIRSANNAFHPCFDDTNQVISELGSYKPSTLSQSRAHALTSGANIALTTCTQVSTALVHPRSSLTPPSIFPSTRHFDAELFAWLTSLDTNTMRAVRQFAANPTSSEWHNLARDSANQDLVAQKMQDQLSAAVYASAVTTTSQFDVPSWNLVD